MSWARSSDSGAAKRLPPSRPPAAQAAAGHEAGDVCETCYGSGRRHPVPCPMLEGCQHCEAGTAPCYDCPKHTEDELGIVSDLIMQQLTDLEPLDPEEYDDALFDIRPPYRDNPQRQVKFLSDRRLNLSSLQHIQLKDGVPKQYGQEAVEARPFDPPYEKAAILFHPWHEQKQGVAQRFGVDVSGLYIYFRGDMPLSISTYVSRFKQARYNLELFFLCDGI